jgi:hypothetical protein
MDDVSILSYRQDDVILRYVKLLICYCQRRDKPASLIFNTDMWDKNTTNLRVKRGCTPQGSKCRSNNEKEVNFSVFMPL